MSHPAPQEPTHLSGEIFVSAAGALLLHMLALTSLMGFWGFITRMVGAAYAKHAVEVNSTVAQILSVAEFYQEHSLLIFLGAVLIDLVIVLLLVRLPPARRWMLTGYNYLCLTLALIIVARGTALIVAPMKVWLEAGE